MGHILLQTNIKHMINLHLTASVQCWHACILLGSVKHKTHRKDHLWWFPWSFIVTDRPGKSYTKQQTDQSCICCIQCLKSQWQMDENKTLKSTDKTDSSVLNNSHHIRGEQDEETNHKTACFCKDVLKLHFGTMWRSQWKVTVKGSIKISSSSDTKMLSSKTWRFSLQRINPSSRRGVRPYPLWSPMGGTPEVWGTRPVDMVRSVLVQPLSEHGPHCRQ